MDRVKKAKSNGDDTFRWKELGGLTRSGVNQSRATHPGKTSSFLCCFTRSCHDVLTGNLLIHERTRSRLREMPSQHVVYRNFRKGAEWCSLRRMLLEDPSKCSISENEIDFDRTRPLYSIDIRQAKQKEKNHAFTYVAMNIDIERSPFKKH